VEPQKSDNAEKHAKKKLEGGGGEAVKADDTGTIM
jgi:hypothetical protein